MKNTSSNQISTSTISTSPPQWKNDSVSRHNKMCYLSSFDAESSFLCPSPLKKNVHRQHPLIRPATNDFTEKGYLLGVARKHHTASPGTLYQTRKCWAKRRDEIQKRNKQTRNNNYLEKKKKNRSVEHMKRKKESFYWMRVHIASGYDV